MSWKICLSLTYTNMYLILKYDLVSLQHTETTHFFVFYELKTCNGDKLDLFLVLKDIIVINILNNVTDVIVLDFTWCHHSLTLLLWRVFSGCDTTLVYTTRRMLELSRRWVLTGITIWHHHPYPWAGRWGRGGGFLQSHLREKFGLLMNILIKKPSGHCLNLCLVSWPNDESCSA